VRAVFAALTLVALSAAGCLGDVLAGPVEPRDLLSSKDYQLWVVEIDAVQGMTPAQSSLDLLRSRLVEVADKPQGIELRADDTLPARGGVWTSRDVIDIARSSADFDTGDGTVVTHLLFLDGRFEVENVLGVAIGHDTIAIFSKVIRDNCTTINGCLSGPESVFRAVLVHEFGHAMGLVDNGIGMVRNHEDPEHPGHSSNSNSVMYYAVETTNVFNLFRGGPPTTFDADDKADLCRAGGKC
jgi:predicted Zn-dependent protease with MMP-like domain